MLFVFAIDFYAPGRSNTLFQDNEAYEILGAAEIVGTDLVVIDHNAEFLFDGDDEFQRLGGIKTSGRTQEQGPIRRIGRGWRIA